MSYPDKADLDTVNIEVNAIPYDAVQGAHEPVNWWTDEPNVGSWVCRDYVLLKSEKLQALGWPSESMTVVECYTEPVGGVREHHAVLAVQLPDETVATILDSRFSQLYPMNAPLTDYQWERRQVAGTTEFEPIA